MDFFTHFFLGFLLSALIVSSVGLELFIFAAIMSMFPDFDVFLQPFLRKKKSYYLSHRGASHSYIIGLFIAIVAGGIFSLFMEQSFFLAFLIAFLFYSIHVTFDLFTTSRIPIFYPISKKEYRLSVDRAVNPILMFSSMLNLVFFLSLYFIQPRLYYTPILWIVFSLIYLTYFIYRIFTRIWLKIRLPNNVQYIPGIFPFVYMVYKLKTSINNHSFQLIKKYQFIHYRKVIVEVELDNNSEIMKYYEKAKILSKTLRFFSKWGALIPIIQLSENLLSIILFLAESYAHRTAYFLKIVFNKSNNEIISIYDGFDVVLPKFKT